MGDGFAFGARLVTVSLLPLRASIIIWLFFVYTSTQADSVQSAKAGSGAINSAAIIGIIKAFMPETISAGADR